MSEFTILNGNKNVIVCFGGMKLQMDGIPPFEFLNYLSSIYKDTYDLLFFIDKHQCWYHKGIDGISTTIDETCEYLNNKIKQYEKVIFIGTSAGGYAAILFGSLCNVTNVLAFIPQTILSNPINDQVDSITYNRYKNLKSRESYTKYSNLKTIINLNTQYILYGSLKYQNDINNQHNIMHCVNLDSFQNVKIIKKFILNIKKMRDSGELKEIIDSF